MPSESEIVVAGVLGAFAFFSAIVNFGDPTWSGAAGNQGDKEKA